MTAWTLTGRCVVCGAPFWTYCDPPHRQACSDECSRRIRVAKSAASWHRERWGMQEEQER